MTRLVVRMTEGGRYLAAAGSEQWVPGIQSARIFTRKNDATSSARNALSGYSRARYGQPRTHRSGSDPFELVPVSIVADTDLKSFEDDSAKLGALEEGGVDNWEGYGEAMRSYRDEEDEG